ncbi:MAG: hypothetical protein M1815_005223 [Lichina confinis]|nr:MAG: hypothetical protein M1815_005223 [Lichina confinis]
MGKPVWTADVDIRLFLTILKVHDISVDYRKVAEEMGMTSSAIKMRLFKLRQKSRVIEPADVAARTSPNDRDPKAAARATGGTTTHRQARVVKKEALGEESFRGDGPASAGKTAVPRKTDKSRVSGVKVEEGEGEGGEHELPAPSDTADDTDPASTPEPMSDSDEKAQLATPESPTPPPRAAPIKAKARSKKAQKAVNRARGGGSGSAQPRTKAPSAAHPGTKPVAKTAARRVESGRVEKRRSLPRGAANTVSYAKLHDPFDEFDGEPEPTSGFFDPMDVDVYGLDSDGEFLNDGV